MTTGTHPAPLQAVLDAVEKGEVSWRQAIIDAFEQGRRSVIDGYQQYGMVTDRDGKCG
jgi:hypothetical protein